MLLVSYRSNSLFSLGFSFFCFLARLLWEKRRIDSFPFDWKKKKKTTEEETTSQQQSVSYQKVNIPWTDQIVKTGIELVFAIRSGQKVLGQELIDWLIDFQLYCKHTAQRLFLNSFVSWQHFWQLGNQTEQKTNIQSLRSLWILNLQKLDIRVSSTFENCKLSLANCRPSFVWAQSPNGRERNDNNRETRQDMIGSNRNVGPFSSRALLSFLRLLRPGASHIFGSRLKSPSV